MRRHEGDQADAGQDGNGRGRAEHEQEQPDAWAAPRSGHLHAGSPPRSPAWDHGRPTYARWATAQWQIGTGPTGASVRPSRRVRWWRRPERRVERSARNRKAGGWGSAGLLESERDCRGASRPLRSLLCALDRLVFPRRCTRENERGAGSGRWYVRHIRERDRHAGNTGSRSSVLVMAPGDGWQADTDRPAPPCGRHRRPASQNPRAARRGTIRRAARARCEIACFSAAVYSPSVRPPGGSAAGSKIGS